VNPKYAEMDWEDLQQALLRCVSSGNKWPSDMLHTSKDIAKVWSLMHEPGRSNLYSGKVVRIDLSAVSQDLYIDLSILASYQVLICLRWVFVGV
jgi:hypothetical protein